MNVDTVSSIIDAAKNLPLEERPSFLKRLINELDKDYVERLSKAQAEADKIRKSLSDFESSLTKIETKSGGYADHD